MKSPKRVAEGRAIYDSGSRAISRDTIRAVVNRIAAHFHPDRIVVFGSSARGGSARASDLDLLVIMKSNLPRHKRATPIRLLFNPTPCAMDILVFTPEEVERWNGTVNHIVTEALSTGVVAYDKAVA
jgi:uncharacterized protein